MILQSSAPDQLHFDGGIQILIGVKRAVRM